MFDWIGRLQDLRGQRCALVTVTEARGSTPREVGAKMIVLSDGTFFGTIGGGHLELQIIEAARACLAQRINRQMRIELCPQSGQCCGGVVDIFVETIEPRPKLYVFGAGHVGKALTQTLQDTHFEVHLIDERPEWIEAQDLPAPVVKHKTEWRHFIEQADWEPNSTYVAVMTHSHDLDEKILEAILQKPTRYLGLIGSDSKWKRFRHRLKECGLTEDALDRVKCPIGLPIGGKSPREVAISVASELIQIHNGARA
jgi:xanthine dehydrogenase accessory factor